MKRFKVGQLMRGRKEANALLAHSSALAIVNKEVKKLDDQISEKSQILIELNADIEWRERLKGDLTPVVTQNMAIQTALDKENQLLKIKEVGVQPSPSDVLIPTKVVYNETDEVQLNPRTIKKRHERTVNALKSIHGQSMQNATDGLWHTLVKVCSPSDLKRYFTHSKKCRGIVSEGKVTKRTKIQERQTKANAVRSIKMLYRGGLISSRKYSAIRISNICVSRPEPLTYKEVVKEIEKIQESLNVSSVDGAGGKGCSRELENTLLKLGDLYLQIDEKLISEHGEGLNWFGENRGNFCVAIGADGAPSGKINTHTSLLLSFLNTVSKVSSCDHNFILVGGDWKEDDPIFMAHLTKLVKEFSEIEEKEYQIRNVPVRFRLEMVPADCKWVATAC
ncbi:uncharacterized protein LOC135501492 [Lineus longissimus]|uniref:uncharacterized protein LOC135501492 n=1 Tax=Lineus longissimus TaxID=88925 RepID=UPI002B4D1277